ncbi:MAG: beta-propeller fold lactonase family protein [Trueperaceae bacterium]|nr:beta-propeller fold lactonase family protein [Trueperaceae bacterium]
MNRREFLKVSAAGVALASVGPLGHVWAQGQDGRRDLIVVSNGGDADTEPSVSLIDPETLQVLATLPLADGFSLPATRWHFARDEIWTGGPNDAVSVYRLSSGGKVTELVTGSSQNYTEITPDGRFVIDAARFEDRYLKIVADPNDPEYGRPAAQFDTYDGASPCDMTMTRDGRYAYVPDRGGDTLSVLRIDPFERIAVIPMESFTGAPLEPYMATVSPDGHYLLVENAKVEGGSETGSESVFDLSDPENPVEVARLTPEDGLGVGPITSEFTPDGRYGIVICRDSSELSIIELKTASVVQSVTFPEGSNPITGTFAYRPSAETFFVPLPGRDAVAAVTLPDFQVATLIPVGARPVGVVYLEASVPERSEAGHLLGVALASGRTFPAGCPDRCCGPV